MRAVFVDPITAKPTTGKAETLTQSQENSLIETLATETAIVFCNRTKLPMCEEIMADSRAIMIKELKALDRKNCIIGVFIKDGLLHLSRK